MKACELPITAATGSVRLNEPTGDTASELTRRVDRAIAYMVEHLDQPLQVAALATQASVSPSHFFAIFKRQTGSAPIDYFIRLRMERARQLLESTPASVKEVAAALGYHDPFYFSRLFKSVNQVAPSEYRLRRKHANGPFFPRCGDGENRRNGSDPALDARVGRGLAGLNAIAATPRQFV